MAALALAGHTVLGFDVVAPLFSVCHEAAAMGCNVNWGGPNLMPESGKPIWKDSDWSLMRAMRAGIKFTQHPSLLNKVFRLFSQQIMDCDYRVRIPVPEAVGVRRYAFPDPSVFDMDGEQYLLYNGNEIGRWGFGLARRMG